MMRFSQITTADQLLVFLNSKRHKKYHHFTTSDALQAILSNQTWRFSPARKMNDLHEYNEKGMLVEWKKIVSACFSHGDEDNIAMWALYGIPWQKGIRITLPGASMQSWFHNLRQNKKWLDENQISSLSLHDIAYYDGYVDSGEASLLWGRGKCKAMQDKNVDIAKAERFTGYIKNSAWRQEFETRLVINFTNDFFDKSFDIPVPEYVFENLEITFGPWFDSDKNKSEYLSEILAQTNLCHNVKEKIINQSRNCFFQGKVELKRHCCQCLHTFKEKDHAGSHHIQ